MQYFRPRQRLDGRWDYTVMWDDKIHSTGYCMKWHDWSKDLQDISPAQYMLYVQNKHKYHQDGHDTKEEAAACYKNYLLDTSLELMVTNVRTQSKCLVCGDWTQHYATVGMSHWDLCEKHNNREQVEVLFKLTADMEIMSS